jgi:cell division septation protein DedD
MDPEIREEEAPPRELRIQGIALFVTGGAFLALLALAFWTGRWFERQVSPPLQAASGRDRSGAVAKDEPKADDLTFFDTLGGGGRAAEPQREARPKPQSPEAAPAAPTAPVARGGPFFVQVFAGRDRRAAEEIVRSLRDRGYPVAVEGEREGQGALYKVRVGGYPERAEAQTVAEKLKREGQAGAWVTKQD